MDILKGYVSDVKFAVPADLDAAQATIYKDDAQIGSPFAATVSSGVATIHIPYNVVIEGGEVRVELSFTYETISQTLTKTFTISTPYLDLWELKDIFGGDASDEEMWTAELAARYVVNAHCGQTFDYTHKTITAMGQGGPGMKLPERIGILEGLLENGNSIYNINTPVSGSFLGYGQILITGGGWFLSRPQYPFSDIKSDINIERSEAGVIYNPFYYPGGFLNGLAYDITGWWGYADVPVNVRQAMKLLVKDYACSDSLYRDRYVQAISTQDWKLEYNTGAFERTGNVKADYLLAPYVKNNWLVI